MRWQFRNEGSPKKSPTNEFWGNHKLSRNSKTLMTWLIEMFMSRHFICRWNWRSMRISCRFRRNSWRFWSRLNVMLILKQLQELNNLASQKTKVHFLFLSFKIKLDPQEGTALKLPEITNTVETPEIDIIIQEPPQKKAFKMR